MYMNEELNQLKYRVYADEKLVCAYADEKDARRYVKAKEILGYENTYRIEIYVEE